MSLHAQTAQMQHKKEHLNKVTPAGLLVALGIIYGDIGTSPLYVLKAIIGQNKISETLVEGGLSCIFWTLTLQTTLKYVILTLQADNKGEGGIFALFALVRRFAKWLVVPAMIGGAALLADGIITPPISVSSAIEGLKLVYPEIQTIPIVIGILTALFVMQRFGTNIVGRTFGPMMLVWFSMLAIIGIYGLLNNPGVLVALNPYYAWDLLMHYPDGFWLLGAVFLCTTGAEALYSDLGHCGRGNIRTSWIFVKSCLLINYFGQGAWLTAHAGETLSGNSNPFYLIMPEWFLLPGIIIATMAAIIASQALISGSFTLISEAIRLNLWPKVKLIYPSNVKGQLYVPSINWLLYFGCVGIVLYFKESANMEAAYGLAITLTMLMTTILLSYYLAARHLNSKVVFVVVLVYLCIELSFLVANLLKFTHGGYISLIIGFLLVSVMFIWFHAANIKNRLTEFVSLGRYSQAIRELSRDESIAKYATHLVYLTAGNNVDQIESKIIYSIFQKRPKRADIYWFLHVDTTDEPYTMDYKVERIQNLDIIRITFKLGFRIEQRINLFFRKVVEEMVENHEVEITSRYTSLRNINITGDFRFVVLEKFLSYENELNWKERLIMEAYFLVKSITTSDAKWYGLDTSSVEVEKVPIIIRRPEGINLKRLYN